MGARMETNSPIPHPHPYMRKGNSIRVDILTRQATVSPVFRRTSIPPIAGRCVKVYDPAKHNRESQLDITCLIESGLYDKYKTPFNFLSKESLLNNCKRKNEPCSSDSGDEETPTTENPADPYCKRRRTGPGRNARTRPYAATHIFRPWANVLPLVADTIARQRENTRAPSPIVTQTPTRQIVKNELAQRCSGKSGASEDIFSSDAETDESPTTSRSAQNEYCPSVPDVDIKKFASAMSSFVSELNWWEERAHDALNRKGAERVTLSEAKELMDEFEDITAGLVESNVADRLEDEIRHSAEYAMTIRDDLDPLFAGAQDRKILDLGLVEEYLKNGMATTFLTPEYVTLTKTFYSVASLRHLLDEALVEADLENSTMLIAECENAVFQLPNLEKLKAHVARSVWLNDAYKYSQKPVNYGLVAELLEGAPEDLREHPLYVNLQEKLKMAQNWIDSLNDPKFSFILAGDPCKAPGGNRDERDEERPKPTSPEEKLKPNDLEEVYNTYQEVELIIPQYRNIEPIYQMWRRFHRRYKRLEALLANENNINCTIECLALLQHAEYLTDYLDLSDMLEPIRVDVEVSLEFEKKCRNLINKFNNWSVSNECAKLKTDWNTMINFRRNALVSKKDLVDVISIIELYRAATCDPAGKTHATTNGIDTEEPPKKPQKNHKNAKKHTRGAQKAKRGADPKPAEQEPAKVDFGAVSELFEDFERLNVKNWQLYRQLEEIYDAGVALTEKADSAVRDLRDGYKSDEVVANLIMVALDAIKFGANLNLDTKLLRTLKYCLWIKRLYNAVNRLYKCAMAGRGEEYYHEILRRMDLSGTANLQPEKGTDYTQALAAAFQELAREPERDGFADLMDTKASIGSYLNIDTNHIKNVASKHRGGESARDRFKKLVDSCQIFALTESHLVSALAPPAQ